MLSMCSRPSPTRLARGAWTALLLALALGLPACATLDARDTPQRLLPEIDRALGGATDNAGRAGRAPGGAGTPDAPIARDLLPPPQVPMPALPTRPPEPRFDIAFADASPQQVLQAIVHGTRYSMIVHPDVKGTITLRLKDTTVAEALDVIREIYGWEWRQDGNRVFVTPGGLQTRVFKVNYPTASRVGRTDVRVSSGSIANPTAPGFPGGQPGAVPGALPGGLPGAAPGALPGGATSPQESSRVTTQTRNDLWAEVEATLRMLVGDKEGRQVIVSPQSSSVIVRALPGEMRVVETFLREMRLSIERQVVLEAKIVEVTLSSTYQSGVNWAAFRAGNTSLSGGILSPGATLGTEGALRNGGALAANAGRDLALGAQANAGLFGLALQTANFAALLTFLETQGQVQVLSSPRIATLNNQKAVLKVGSDDFFVTNVSTTTVASTAGNTTSPTITVQPFFSGIALDVTPQIDDAGNIILHVHPSVSQVEERQKQLNLGSLGSFTLPLASSSVRETDAIVRVPDGNIVAIGGLMRQDASSNRSQVPGAGDLPGGLGRLLGQRNLANTKQELVILIKPTVIHSQSDADADREQSGARLRGMLRP